MSKTPILTEVRSIKLFEEGVYELHFSFSNDRHHAVILNKGDHPKQVAVSLKRFSDQLLRDKKLK